MFKKLKDKKGFTLVELIVVLVILAILAALLVPALTKYYIDKANNEKIIATTRQVVVAAQTEASEAYGKNSAGKLAGDDVTVKTGQDDTNSPVHIADIVKLAEVGSVGSNSAFTGTNGVTSVSVTMAAADGKVTSVIVEQSGKKCTYTATPADGASPYTVTKSGS